MDKPALAVLIGRMKPKSEGDDGPDADSDDEGGDEGLHAGAEAVLSAIEKKDAAELADALHSFFEMCDARPHVEGEHEE